MKAAKLVMAAVLGIALAGGGYLVYQNASAPKPAASSAAAFTQVVDVRQGNVASTVSVVGQLEATQSSALTFEHMSGSAKLLRLEVKNGAVVTAGQVLASIDPAPYQQALDQAKSDHQAAVEKLADLKSPATPLEIAKADLAVAQADYNLIKAQQDLTDLAGSNLADLEKAAADAKRALATAEAQVTALGYDTSTEANITKLKATEDKASAEYNRLAAETWDSNDYRDQTRINWNKAMDAHDARATAEINQQISVVNAKITALKARQTAADAQNALTAARTGVDTVALAKARLAVESAKVALTSAKESKADTVRGADAAALNAAQADLDKKKIALDSAQTALNGTRLTAPFAGTVLKTNVAAGNLIGSNTTILTLADLTTLRVAASIDETTIKKVSQGQQATITFDALPGQTLRGTVGEIPLQGTLQGSVMVYSVPILLTGAERQPLLVGMTANVRVQAASAQNAVLVPTIGLQRAGGAYQVMLVNDANPQGTPVPVEIGVADGIYTQITKGLSVGDKILVTGSLTTPTPTGQQQGPGGPNVIIFDGSGPPPGGGFQPGGGGGPQPGR